MDDQFQSLVRYRLSRRDLLKAGGAGVSLLALGPILEACTGSTSQPTTAGGTIHFGKAGELLTYDPQTAVTIVSSEIHQFVYETLVTTKDDLTVGPWLAASWDAPSTTTYVFHLRDGVKFSNGRSMTASDVVGSLKRLISPSLKATWASQMGSVKDIVEVDSKTVRVELDSPNATFLPALENINAAILPMQELTAGTFDPTKALLGTGPFMLDSHTQNESWNFKRNPYYWRSGYPRADALACQIITDPSAKVAALRDGSIDLAVFDDPGTLALLKSVPNVKVVNQSQTGFYHILNNATKGPLRDVKLRQAFSLAIDRQQVRDIALGGTGQVTGPTSPAFNVIDVKDLPNNQFDLTRAQQLLQQAGAQNLEITMGAPAGYPSLVKIAQVVQASVAKAGIKVNLLTEDTSTWTAGVIANPMKYDTAPNFFEGYSDPVMATLFWYPPSWDKGIVVPDAKIDDLLAQSRNQALGAARNATIRQLVQQIDADQNISALVSTAWVIAYRQDRIAPKFASADSYGNPLIHIEEYTLTGH